MKNNIPQLRFPEFKDCGEWEEKELSVFSKIITEKQGVNKYLLLSVEAGKGLISQIEKFGQEIAGASSKNYYVIRENNFAYNKSATKAYPEGYIALYTGKEVGAVPNSIFTCFSIDLKQISPNYLNYLFEQNHHGKWLKKYIAVGGRAHGSLAVNNSDLLKLPIPLPKSSNSIHEQQKIADCLSSLDTLINAQSEKIEKLNTHKKGLLQKLFPQEGQSVPEFRFPEFRDCEEWENNNLGNICNITTGKLDANAMKQHGIYRFYTCAKDYYLIDSYAFDCEALLISGNGANVGYIHYYSGKFNAYQRTYVLFSFKENIFYIKKFLEKNLASRISNEKRDGNTPYIILNTLKQMNILLPLQKKEQQKIADCLSSLDDLISQHTQKLNLLTKHKQGLMQGLFPCEG